MPCRAVVYGFYSVHQLRRKDRYDVKGTYSCTDFTSLCSYRVVESVYSIGTTALFILLWLQLKHFLSLNNLCIQWIILKLFCVDASVRVAIQLG
jgi:hypothetical protein